MGAKSRVYVSASQIKNAFGKDAPCARRWGFGYIDGKKQPTSPQMQFGTDGHTHGENWLRHGKKPDDSAPGKAFAQGIKHLPAPGPHLLIEKKFEYKLTDEAWVIGYIDCVDPSGDLPLVLDHKFTSDMRYAMSEADLLEDPQAQIYADWARREYSVDEVNLRWVYYIASGKDMATRKPKGSKAVEGTIVKSDRWNMILGQADQLVDWRRNVDKGEDLAANLNSCDAFGGCYYKKQGMCSAVPTTVSLGARLKQFNKTAKAIEETDEGAKPGAKKEKKMGSLVEKLKAGKPVSKNTEPKVNPPEGDELEAAPVKKASKSKLKVDKSKTKETKAPEPSPVPLPDAVPGLGLVVCFDCIPTKGTLGKMPQVPLTEFLRPAMKRVCEDFAVADWGLVDYGKGPHALAAALDFILQDGRPDVLLTVDSSSREARAVKETLRHYADLVVQGVR